MNPDTTHQQLASTGEIIIETSRSPAGVHGVVKDVIVPRGTIDWQETAIEVVTRMRAAVAKGEGITLSPGELSSVTHYLQPL